jgi:anti-sigma B factor antagonist
VVSMLGVEISGDERLTRIALTGELDLDSKRLLEDAMRSAPAAGQIELDLAGLSYCDSAGIGALVAAQKQARAAGRGLLVVNAHGLVHSILQVSGVLVELTRTH